MEYNFYVESISLYTDYIKTVLIALFTYFTFLRIVNIKMKKELIEILPIIGILVVSIIVIFIRYKIGYCMSIFTFPMLLSLICSFKVNNEIVYSLFITIISVAVNYIVYFFVVFITFLINIMYSIKNDNFNLMIIFVIHALLLFNLFRIRKIKNGISYLNKKRNNINYLELIIINISVICSFSFIIFTSSSLNLNNSRKIFIVMIIYASILFITIQKSIQAYYKQKLLIQDLTETKKELEEKKKEVEDLEKENLKFSMRSHSIAHKQRALEYKLNKVLQSLEVAEEIDLKNRMENIAKEAYIAPLAMELTKTEIEPIDDMLEYMQAECVKDNIEFNLQINGNIYKMVNNYIKIQELEILLADHIKDAIIAINHTDNINRSILVKIGEYNNCYGIYIYDSGVNFPKEILENLGKKPVTSYPDEGGTGMGYMSTFEILSKYKASLKIEEFGTPSKENFTKVVSVIFDKKNEFKIL